MTWQIIRQIQQAQVGVGKTVQIIHAPGGPRGAAAAQDIGWSIATNLSAGEVINGPPAIHPATYAVMRAHSDSGFSTTQTITLNQVSAGQVVASAQVQVTASGNDWSAAITALSFAAGDVPQLVLPNPADPQCTDISISVGSNP